MIRENQKILNQLNILSDAVLLFASFIASYYLRFYIMPDGLQSLQPKFYLYTICVITPVQLLVYKFFGLYESNRKKNVGKIVRNILLINIAVLALTQTGLFFFKFEDFSRGVLYIFLLLESVLLCGKHIINRRILHFMRSRGYNQKYVILAGCGVTARRCFQELRNSPELGYQVVGYVSSLEDWPELPYLGSFTDIEVLLEKYKPDEFIAALDDEHTDVGYLAQACEASGTRFFLVPYYVQFFSNRPQVDSLNGIPMFSLRRIPLDNMVNAFIKRTFDVIGSLLLIVLTSPLMLAVAIGVKLSSPGPVLFRQKRIGYGSKPFTMYKFRSMRLNLQEDTAWSQNSDPRTPPFGSFIRKYSIDELPQLFNVLLGDMSLVGPRPELPYFVEQFRKEIPRYMVKHQVRPGMTGWAQVNGLRGDTSIKKRIDYDIYYIENWSFLLDIKILLRTLGHISNKEELVKRKAVLR